MPPLERTALELCRRAGGAVLDVGAGGGSHCLALAELGVAAEAVDVCPQAVEVMRRRGVKAEEQSMWNLRDLSRYDLGYTWGASSGEVVSRIRQGGGARNCPQDPTGARHAHRLDPGPLKACRTPRRLHHPRGVVRAAQLRVGLVAVGLPRRDA